MRLSLDRYLRVVTASVAVVLTAVLALPASAQSQCTGNCAAATTASAQARLLSVDLPAPNANVSNGDTVDIGGWTFGSRVDAYLDGPAGVGEGIGSIDVATPRPDVARLTANANSGFDLGWQPLDLSAGPHTLYVYALVDGVWTVQTVPIMGEGNIFQSVPEMNDSGD